jgi:nucleoside-diphosphate-sugar epimerase
MNILLLGGDGFIGSHLLKKHLQLGDKCFVLDINNLRTKKQDSSYKYIKFDFAKQKNQFNKLLIKLKPDLIYNCVAVATPHFYVKYPIETFNLDFKINYENICKPIINYNIPLIHFSTSEVYGKKWDSIYKEDTSNLILGPTNKSRWIYATSKILLEQLLIASSLKELVIIRPQNFCGADMDWLPDINNNLNRNWKPRLPACFLNSLLTKQALTIVKPGTQKRCYTYIDDAIEGIISIYNNWDKCKNKEIFNIGNPHNEMDIEHIAKKYIYWWEKITNTKSQGFIFKSAKEYYGNGYEDCERRLFSNKKIYKYTKWTPKIDIDKTIYKTIHMAIQKFNLK